MKRVKFPQYLSRPMQFLWWETDELAVMLVLVGLAMQFGGWFWFLPLVGGYGFIRLKREAPKDFMRHVFYFVGLTKFKGYPEYWDKEFRE